jgi:two-component system, cell cycle response regulator
VKGQTPVVHEFRLLVVDDSEAQRQAVRKELHDMNVLIEEASSGLMAIKKAAQLGPSLVTLDIELGDFGGYRVLEHLRAQEATRGLPVIMISGSPNEEERFRALEDGAIAYFSKPFPPGALRALVSDIIDRIARNRATSVWCLAEREGVVERLSRILVVQGYQLRVFASVQELVDTLESNACDVLILDLRLRQQGAYRVLDHLNLLEEEARPRILGLMAGSAAADVAHAFHRGLSDFVGEQYSGQELNARVDQLVYLRRKTADLRALALVDTLTKLPNRGQLERELSSALAKTIQLKGQLGVVMIDVDHFKRLNDTFGHPFGDVVLQKIAAALRDCLRANDVVGRYGGEEFMMLVPKATHGGMKIVTERLRQHVEGLRLTKDEAPVPVTVSIGTCIWDYTALLASPSLNDMVKPADEALYKAKHAGRNRICTGETIAG